MHSFYDIVWQQAERSPDATALVDDRTDRRLTYQAMMEEVDVVAAGLQARGIKSGDRMATCLPNMFEHALTVLALQRLGAVPALMNSRLSPAEIASLVEAGGMSGLVLLPQAETVDAVTKVMKDGAPVLTIGGAVAGAEDFGTCRGDVASLPPVPKPAPEDACIIFYTSGTTGLPKAVVLSHRTTEPRVLWLATQGGLRHGPHTRALGCMPLAHCIGFHGVFLVTLAFGGAYHCVSSFNPVEAVEMVEREQLTYVFAAPTLLYAMKNAPNYSPEKMRSMELCLYGGAVIDPKLVDHIDEEWENCTIRHIYGTTELMCSGYNPDPVGDTAALRAGYYTRLRYIELGGGPDDQIGPGEEGELIIDATVDTTFTEYLGRPDATSEKLVDGWYYTGDVITVDERGYFTLQGRVDDMIRTGGENVHPSEVEAVLQSHPDVRENAVISLSDDKWGQIIVGCVVSEDDISPEDLDAHFKASDLAGFKRPKAYFKVDQIPHNPGNGNVLRRHLRDAAVVARDEGAAAYTRLGG